MNSSKATVLCVDDEVNILNTLKRVLRKEGYRLATATSAGEALEMLSREKVQVIICDQRMPEMDGVTLLKKVREEYPQIIRIILTGFIDVDTMKDAVNQGHIFKFLLKPWDDDDLILEIRQALKQYELLEANRRLNKKVMLQNDEFKRFNEHLESLVRERTEEIVIRNKALELAQAVLTDLPIPIAGVDSEGMVVMTNHALDRMFAGIVEFQVGRMIDDYFIREISQYLHHVLSGHAEADMKLCSIGGLYFTIHCVPLSGNFKGRGMVLSFSPGKK